MSNIRSLLSAYQGKIFVYLATAEISRQFLQDAENEGFTFGDGVKPTQRPTSDIFAIHPDMTLNYVGFAGHIAYRLADRIGDQPLWKIDYRELLQGNSRS